MSKPTISQFDKLPRWGQVVTVIIFIFIASKIIGVFMGTGEGEQDQKVENKTPAQIKEERIKNQFSAWDGDHKKLSAYTKEIMNDPDSYEHDKTTYIVQGDTVIVFTKYRGKNKFGGVVRASISAYCDLDGNVLSIISSE